MHTETKVAPNVKQAVPFFTVSNMQASLQFYMDGLGFKMVYQWIDEGKLRWCWLELGHAALMLQESRPDLRHLEVPEGKAGSGVSIYFQCEDALAIYREVRARGIPARRPFVGNHMWVTSVSDPDGYKFFSRGPTDVPEETEFSE